MARTKRNNPDAAACLYNMEEKRIAAAIYARLSVKDNGDGKEAMRTQVEYLQHFLSGRKDLKLAGIYQDNGRTGTDFARPAFAEMMEAIRRGEIGCVVVKDLSRFGRNYMEAGVYLEQIFPLLGVRFLSVDDHYDSREAGGNRELEISVKNICHHAYAKDISAKICTHLELRKKCGWYLAKTAPYGYRIARAKTGSGPERRMLVTDETQAKVVRRIFALRLQGVGVTAIARLLNDEGIPTGRMSRNGKEKEAGWERQPLWSASGVRFILENPVYCGCIVEQKSKRAYYLGEGEKKIPREEWHLIENTHEAIIEREAYEAVRELMEQAARHVHPADGPKRTRPENCLKGLIICGYCRRRMQRDSGYCGKDGSVRYRFRCPEKYKKREGCSAPSVEEAALLELLRAFLTCAALCMDAVPAFLTDRGHEKRFAPSAGKWYQALVRKVMVQKGQVRLFFAFTAPWEGFWGKNDAADAQEHTDRGLE